MWAKDNLIDFIVDAKKISYASGNESIRLEKGIKEYSFNSNDFSYKDTYFANLIDAGQEVVWFKDLPIWVMLYRGGMVNNDSISRECFSFLEKAISNLSKNFPTRGPAKFEDFPFSYYNVNQGDIFNFFGTEYIYLNSVLIYTKNYIGGLVKHRDVFFPEIIEPQLNVIAQMQQL